MEPGWGRTRSRSMQRVGLSRCDCWYHHGPGVWEYSNVSCCRSAVRRPQAGRGRRRHRSHRRTRSAGTPNTAKTRPMWIWPPSRTSSSPSHTLSPARSCVCASHTTNSKKQPGSPTPDTPPSTMNARPAAAPTLYAPSPSPHPTRAPKRPTATQAGNSPLPRVNGSCIPRERR